MKKILILAQVPPPFYGQSIMQEYLVNAKWNWCEKKHIKLDFSDNIGNVGIFKFSKIWKLIKIVLNVWKERLSGKIDVLYYPPAGPHKIPFYRDFLILSLIKICAKKIVFQFHAGDFNGLQKLLNGFELKLAKVAYNNPDAAIVLLPSLKEEVNWINPKEIHVVPNGITDSYPIFRTDKRENKNDNCNILFVGLLSPKKGVFVCLDAAKIMRDKNLKFKFIFVGGWYSNETKNEAAEFVKVNKLEAYVEFLGVKSGDEKWKVFAEADIFCMPTYETEAMPITIIEAMMMELPVVTTNWRSIPDIVNEDTTGFLVQIRNSLALADKIMCLIYDKSKRVEMGKKGREKFLKEYTLERHLLAMEDVFKII